MSDDPHAIDVSIIVPTLNEAGNLPELLRRIDAAMTGRRYEVLVIDDNSTDDTVAVSDALAERYPLSLDVRTNPKDGLSGAVLEGMQTARGEVFVVMDADLQHPPERLPDLIGPVERGETEFALGSRYVAGGTTAEKWGPLRRFNSKIATLLAWPFAGNVRDPMSGFFALRRQSYKRAERLTPLGYKVGLELMCKCRVGDVLEVPIHFDTRAHGESKLTIKQQFKYLEHLSRLYDFYYPRLSPIAKFLIATACGWFVGFAAYMVMLRWDVWPGTALPASYLAAIAVTAVFHLRYVRTQREFLVTRRPWTDFVLISLGEFIACTLSALWWATHYRQPVTATELFVLSFGTATLIRYILRKELMQDIRGLRKDLRREDSTNA